MIRQDCKELERMSDLPFEDYACKLFACFYFDEQINGTYYDAKKVIEKTTDLLGVGYIDDELSVYEKSEGINKTKMLLRFLGLPVMNVVYRPDFYKCKDGEYEILKLVKPGYAHFVPGDGNSNYTWDSLGIRKQQKDYTLKSKRIIIMDKKRSK
jgi:hypothetical protein